MVELSLAYYGKTYVLCACVKSSPTKGTTSQALDTYLLLVQARYREWQGAYCENRRTLKEMGSPITTMCTSNPRIRS